MLKYSFALYEQQGHLPACSFFTPKINEPYRYHLPCHKQVHIETSHCLDRRQACMRCPYFQYNQGPFMHVTALIYPYYDFKAISVFFSNSMAFQTLYIILTSTKLLSP